jgi:hypothetical protein
MKKLYIVLLTLLLSAQTYAATPMSWGTYTSQVPKERRVAIVLDSRGTETQRNDKALKNQGALGRFIEMLKEHGAEPHIYNVEYFEDTISTKKDFPAITVCANRRPRWEKLGDNYPAAILLDFNNVFGTGGTAFVTRYFRADSTNTQIIHFGDGNATAWRDADGIPAAGSSCSLSVAGFRSLGGWTIPVVSNGRDTVYGSNVPFQIRKASLQPGLKEVVKYFNVPSKSDSIALSGDTLIWAFKIRALNTGHSGRLLPHTEMVMSTMNTISGAPYPESHILWALLSKYVTLSKIRISMNWDDVGNWGLDPSFPGTPAILYLELHIWILCIET